MTRVTTSAPDPTRPAGSPDEQARAAAEDLGAFVAASPSSFHAAAQVRDRLVARGFSELDEAAPWPSSPGGYVVVRDGGVIAWVVPTGAGPTTPFTVLGAHTDSPGFVLKPRPTTGRDGWVQAGVEVYGGPLLNSWLDRELVLAGRLVTRDGASHLTRTEPLLRIPQLAIHLDRAVNDGLTLDRQQHTQPVWSLGDPSRADLLAVLAGAAGIDPADVAGYDVVTADAQHPAVFGAGGTLLASGRLDNLASVHAGLRALEGIGPEGLGGDSPIAVLAAFDHEEIGSETRSGAAGPFLADVLSRVGAGLGASADEHHRALAGSLCVSADCGHGVHPNYPERHDPANRPRLGSGVLLKINANQRYATDGVGAAAWHRICADAAADVQEFVSNNVMPCGSTIGPITATRLGIRTVDVGLPLLSMHSARELCAIVDVTALGRAATSTLRGAWR